MSAFFLLLLGAVLRKAGSAQHPQEKPVVQSRFFPFCLVQIKDTVLTGMSS